MNTPSISFQIEDSHVVLHGHPELEGREGILIGDGIALFSGRRSNNYELYLVNTQTGKIRQLSTSGGELLVEDCDIDYTAIERECEHGIYNAKNKLIRYGGLGRWSNFKEGICAISWTLYPYGRYFADSDGFGMDDNEEEVVYAVFDTNLDLAEPFRPVKDVDKYLKEIRRKEK